MRTKPPAPPARIGLVRGTPMTYEVNEYGGTYGLYPATGWTRGQVIRAAQPTVNLAPAVPMYDPSLLNNPAAPNL